jgi:tetratricopeptide (TPR) repeat protein
VLLSSWIFHFHIKLLGMSPGVGPQPQKTDDHFEQGLTLAKQGRWKEALAAYQESLRANPDNPETHLNIGFVYYEMGYDQKAQKAFERASKLQTRGCRPR